MLPTPCSIGRMILVNDCNILDPLFKRACTLNLRLALHPTKQRVMKDRYPCAWKANKYKINIWYSLGCASYKVVDDRVSSSVDGSKTPADPS